MSLLFKRKGSPYFYVTKTRESTRTANRKHAEEYARKALTERWRTDALGEKTRTWTELVEDWLDAKEGAASYAQDRMVIDRFTELLQRRDITALAKIDAELISDYGKAVKAERSPSTANRHFTTLRAMLNRAHSKGWLHAVPRIENYSLAKREHRWVTLEQFNTILPHLPEWVADMAIMAVQTGMRFSNVAGLRWEWITPDHSVVIVPAVATKTRRTYTVPLSTTAKKILANRLQFQRLSPHVFTGSKQGSGWEKPVFCVPTHDMVRVHWEKATEAAGEAGLRWHDLRHTWASLHTQRGTPDRILKEMGGWASTRMLDTYSHLATSHLVEFANNIG